MSKLLIDTNVLIYSIDKDSKYFDKAQKIFSEQIELYTTSKNISEFLSVVTRLPKNPLSLNNALQIAEDITSLMTILYPTPESLIIFLDLLQKYKPMGLKIHDYEILSIGIANKITTVATFNEKDFIKVEELDLFVF
jgi:predicted nucleic acid-binding protein